jgi:hypothetical protein
METLIVEYQKVAQDIIIKDFINYRFVISSSILILRGLVSSQRISISISNSLYIQKCTSYLREIAGEYIVAIMCCLLPCTFPVDISPVLSFLPPAHFSEFSFTPVTSPPIF